MNKRRGVLAFVTFALYLVIGGSVFMTLENNKDPINTGPSAAITALTDFVDLITLDNETAVRMTSNESWNAYVQDAYDNFTSSLTPSNGTIKLWSLYDGIFLCLTVATTIGYGNIAPSTEAGRVFCVFYGFIGIPLAGILFAGIGDFFSNKLLKSHERTKSRSSSPGRALVISTVIYLIPCFLLFLFLPAGLFMILEDWSFLEGFYYAFITLTTVGFGDYVAGTKGGDFEWVYKIALMLWIIFGLGYLAMILNFIAKAMKSKHVKKIEKTVSRNLKQTQEALSKEMEYVLKTMNEFYTNRFKVGNSLKRTSSCPSLDRPASKMKRSGSAGSMSDAKPSSPFDQRENPANFIFDLAVALACGDLHDSSSTTTATTKEEEMRSRTGSIAQLLTMALLPPNLGSRQPSESNFSRDRNITRRSLPPTHDFLLKNSSLHAKLYPGANTKQRKSLSLLEGLLFPLDPKGSSKHTGKFGDRFRQSDRSLDDHPALMNGGLSRSKDAAARPGRMKISRSISNPGTFRYMDKFVDHGHQSSLGSSDRHGHERSSLTFPKCDWIIGGGSSVDDVAMMSTPKINSDDPGKNKHGVEAHVDHLGHPASQHVPSVEFQPIKVVPSTPALYRPENEMSTVIEEEDQDNSSSGSATNISVNDSNSSDRNRGVSSQETISIDILEKESKSGNVTSDASDGRTKDYTVVNMPETNSRQDETRM